MVIKRFKFAVLVIDMINDYLSPLGKLYCPSGHLIIPAVKTIIEQAHLSGWPVIYINTAIKEPTSPLACKWGLHALKGSWGAEVIPELRPGQNDLVVEKENYDGFFGTDLEKILKELGVDTVVAVGIHTHVCVLLTALGAFYRGYKVIALEEGMTTDKPDNHISRLPFFNSHIGQLMTLEEFLRTYSGID